MSEQRKGGEIIAGSYGRLEGRVSISYQRLKKAGITVHILILFATFVGLYKLRQGTFLEVLEV